LQSSLKSNKRNRGQITVVPKLPSKQRYNE
jgi:hypothetical protein